MTLSHGTPLRLLVEEGSLRGEHIVQIGLRGYWPDPEDFEWARRAGLPVAADGRDRASAAWGR